MTCGIKLEARRNADFRVTFTPASRKFTFSGMVPLFSVRLGDVVLLQVGPSATPNGSNFVVVGDSVVLTIEKADMALLDSAAPDTDAETLFFDVTLTDGAGFENWLTGGPFILLGLNDVTCGGCNSIIEASLGGQCVQVSIEGGNLAAGASLTLQELNEAAARAEQAAEDAEAAAASIPGLVVNKADTDGGNIPSMNVQPFRESIGVSVPDLTALKIAKITDSVFVGARSVAGDGFAGTFEWNSGDQSMNVADDPLEGVWVTTAGDPTGLLGAWKRVFDGSVNVRWFGAVGDGATDDTFPINVAGVLASKNVGTVFFPEGRYRVTDMVTKPKNVSWRGVDRTESVIYADAAFNLSASAVVKYAAGENSCGIFDLGIECYQDPATPDRASLINYPRMLDLRATPRFQLDRVRLAGGKTGADITQNSGGGWIGRIETGCTDVGIDIDGPLDFIHIESVHDWVFVGSQAATGLGQIMRDGQRIALHIGGADGLSIGQFAAFMGRVVVDGLAANNIPIQFGSLQLDGDKSALEVGGKIIQIANFYSTKGNAPITSLKITGGRVTISNAEFATSGTAVTPIEVSGGMLAINGGRLLAAADVNARMATVTGGLLSFRNASFDLSTSALRTVPFIASTGGALIVQNCRTPITTNGGVLISVSLDSGNHNISGNSFQGWSITLPANPVLGCYGSNAIARSTFTPTVTFATPGDFSPTYVLQDGRYWDATNGIQFQARIVFDSNAYSTASGELRVGGFPISLAGVMDRAPITVGRGDKLTRTANYQNLAAEVTSTANAIRIIQIGGGLLATPITPANLPASTANFDITISGFIPKF